MRQRSKGVERTQESYSAISIKNSHLLRKRHFLQCTGGNAPPPPPLPFYKVGGGGGGGGIRPPAPCSDAYAMEMYITQE